MGRIFTGPKRRQLPKHCEISGPFLDIPSFLLGARPSVEVGEGRPFGNGHRWTRGGRGGTSKKVIPPPRPTIYILLLPPPTEWPPEAAEKMTILWCKTAKFWLPSVALFCFCLLSPPPFLPRTGEVCPSPWGSQNLFPLPGQYLSDPPPNCRPHAHLWEWLSPRSGEGIFFGRKKRSLLHALKRVCLQQQHSERGSKLGGGSVRPRDLFFIPFCPRGRKSIDFSLLPFSRKREEDVATRPSSPRSSRLRPRPISPPPSFFSLIIYSRRVLPVLLPTRSLPSCWDRACAGGEYVVAEGRRMGLLE